MQRNLAIDNLKCIGLLCIILAHVQSPTVLAQLRNFDVPLMIICSALLFFRKPYTLSLGTYVSYFTKRIKRLVLPTWLFLTIYFGLAALSGHPVKASTMLSSYILYWGIGYVWIIRIFLLAALLLPILDYCLTKYRTRTYIGMIIVFALYETIATTGIFSSKTAQFFISFIIPLSGLICFAYWIKHASNRSLFCASCIWLFIFLITGYVVYIITGKVHATAFMKYPFRIYYLSYAMGVSGLLIWLFRNEKITHLFNNAFVTFISAHSLWIYLWHILFLAFWGKILSAWYLKFVLVVICATGITLIQARLVCWLDKKHLLPVVANILKG